MKNFYLGEGLSGYLKIASNPTAARQFLDICAYFYPHSSVESHRMWMADSQWTRCGGVSPPEANPRDHGSAFTVITQGKLSNALWLSLDPIN